MMLGKIADVLQEVVVGWVRSVGNAVKRFVQPASTGAAALAGAARDAIRPRYELIAENALLRQQLIVVRRKIKRPPLGNGDRILMLLLARLNKAWRDALHLVKPDTLLR